MVCVTRDIWWSMGHRLWHHNGLCRFPHGHNYHARVSVERDTPRQTLRRNAPDDGMVIDFTALDRVLKSVIDTWDHAFMLEQGDPLESTLRYHAAETGEGGRLVVIDGPPTAERIAQMIVEQVSASLVRTGTRVLQVEVFEGPKSSATAMAVYE